MWGLGTYVLGSVFGEGMGVEGRDAACEPGGGCEGFVEGGRRGRRTRRRGKRSE